MSSYLQCVAVFIKHHQEGALQCLDRSIVHKCLFGIGLVVLRFNDRGDGYGIQHTESVASKLSVGGLHKYNYDCSSQRLHSFECTSKVLSNAQLIVLRAIVPRKRIPTISTYVVFNFGSSLLRWFASTVLRCLGSRSLDTVPLRETCNFCANTEYKMPSRGT